VVWGDILIGVILSIPCFFGVSYGPLIGVVVAAIGTLLGGAVSHFLPPWYWFVGIAALGFISGLAFISTRGVYNKVTNILLAVVYSFAGILIWAIIRLSGDFTNETQSLGIPFSNVLTLTLVQLVSLVPLVIALIVANAFTKARAR